MTVAVTVVDRPVTVSVARYVTVGAVPYSASPPVIRHRPCRTAPWMSSPPGSLLVMLTSSTAVGCPFGLEAVMAALTVTILLFGGQITFGDSCNAIAGGSRRRRRHHDHRQLGEFVAPQGETIKNIRAARGLA